ncbi:MAG: type II toxin-antitoxin system PemK/MazF family toxin [Clostridia bacterium]|nr:type II toxin-antitoxin system PemK/MazF family toxin [Clostridia bacterium]
MFEIRKGQIYLANLNQTGSLQNGLRPVLIVQNDTGNLFAPTTIVVPLTTVFKKVSLPTHVIIPKEDSGLLYDSMALCEQITTINKTQLENCIAEIRDQHVKFEIREALLVSLGENV